MAESKFIVEACIPFWVRGIKIRSRKERNYHCRENHPVRIGSVAAHDMETALSYEYFNSYDGRLKLRTLSRADDALLRPLYAPNWLPRGAISIEDFEQTASRALDTIWFDSPFGKIRQSPGYEGREKTLGELFDFEDLFPALKEVTANHVEKARHKAQRSADGLLAVGGLMHKRMPEPMWRATYRNGKGTLTLVESGFAEYGLSTVFFRGDKLEEAKAFLKKVHAQKFPDGGTLVIRPQGKFKEVHPDYAFSREVEAATLQSAVYEMRKYARNAISHIPDPDSPTHQAAVAQIDEIDLILGLFRDMDPDAPSMAYGFLQGASEPYTKFMRQDIEERITGLVLEAAADWDLTAIAAPSQDDEMLEALIL